MLSANLSSPMGRWQEQGTVIPTAHGRKLVNEDQARQVVQRVLSSLPPAVQKEVERCMASGQAPDQATLNLMERTINQLA